LHRALQDENLADYSSAILFLLYQNINYETAYDNMISCDFNQEDFEIFEKLQNSEEDDKEMDTNLWKSYLKLTKLMHRKTDKLINDFIKAYQANKTE
jgi:hypothetical protein